MRLIYSLDEFLAYDDDSTKHATPVKKQIHPQALQALEPLFRYFKMVCESNLTFPRQVVKTELSST